MQKSEPALATTRIRQKRVVTAKNTWTLSDDQLLTDLVMLQPDVPSWVEIAAHFPQKTMQQVSERWTKVIDPTLVKGSWTKNEDEIIIKFVHENGTKKWAKLAELLPGRIGKQCRERWKNHLDPSMAHTAWSQEEDAMLIALHEKLGNKWAKIAAMMVGRSDNSVKNRWNSTLSKYEKKRTPKQKVPETNSMEADDAFAKMLAKAMNCESIFNPSDMTINQTSILRPDEKSNDVPATSPTVPTFQNHNFLEKQFSGLFSQGETLEDVLGE